MKKIACLSIYLFVLVFGANAQNTYYSEVDLTKFDPNGLKAEEGTFQFIITEPKFQPAFTTDVLYFVEQHREEDRDVVIELSQYVSLFIPSKRKVTAENFEKLEPFQN